MKGYYFIISALLWIMVQSPSAMCREFTKQKPADVILIIYTTKQGKTGHVGMAVSNHRIMVRDTLVDNRLIHVNDTVKDGSLTYFDLWGPPEIDLDEHDKNLSARYYTLPRSSAEERITIDYFLTKGLPHSYNYPCDALLRIKTDVATDSRMKEIALRIQEERDYFNTRKYNCTDYILTCLNELLDSDLSALEYIPFSWSSTPNRFYREVVSRLEVEVVKAAGEEVNESFFKQRIMNHVLFNPQ